MLPLAPIVFPLTCPPVRPRGVGAVCADADEAATLRRLEGELEVQVCEALLFHFSFLFIPLSVFPPTPRTHSLESLSLSYLCSQRAVIRKALAEMLPLGQKTVRGSLNALIYQAKEASPDDDEEEEVDTSEDE